MMETHMQTLSIDEAISLVPAIGARSPSSNVSNHYQFVSTRDILERVQQNGWRITNATAQNKSEYAQHRVTLVHSNNLDISQNAEGIPRIEMFNSHNKTRRLLFAVGYFRFICSNGLIVASGPAETIRTKHRFTDNKLNSILEQVATISERFPTIQSTINDFKSRKLSEEEQANYVKYAIKGRYIYRPQLPKRFKNLDESVQKFLQSRREQDSGNSVWEVYNRVQENFINGIEGYSQSIRGYSDTIRVNQLLWKGAETALQFQTNQLNSSLNDLLIKDGKKGRISA
jgi:hypothetical protein